MTAFIRRRPFVSAVTGCIAAFASYQVVRHVTYDESKSPAILGLTAAYKTVFDPAEFLRTETVQGVANLQSIVPDRSAVSQFAARQLHECLAAHRESQKLSVQYAINAFNADVEKAMAVFVQLDEDTRKHAHLTYEIVGGREQIQLDLDERATDEMRAAFSATSPYNFIHMQQFADQNYMQFVSDVDNALWKAQCRPTLIQEIQTAYAVQKLFREKTQDPRYKTIDVRVSSL